VALNVHEISNGNNDLLNLLGKLTGWCKDKGLALLDIWVELLEDRNGESCGLSRTRLGLSDNIVTCIFRVKTLYLHVLTERLTLDDRHNCALLDSRWALETIGIDTCAIIRLGTKQFVFMDAPLRSSGFKFMVSKESTVSS